MAGEANIIQAILNGRAVEREVQVHSEEPRVLLRGTLLRLFQTLDLVVPEAALNLERPTIPARVVEQVDLSTQH